MHRAIDRGSGGSRPQQFTEEHSRNPFGMGRVGKLLLCNESVAVEPFEQMFAEGGDHLGLRIVDMGVDEAGNNKTVVEMAHMHAGRHAVG